MEPEDLRSSHLFERPLNVKKEDEAVQELKEWALNLGATYVCHFVQQASTLNPQREDLFFHRDVAKKPLSLLSAKDLKGVDLSQGHVLRDPKAPPFIHEIGRDKVLCLPSFLFSDSRASEDHRSALYSAEEKLSEAVDQMLTLLSTPEEMFSCLRVVQPFSLTSQKMVRRAKVLGDLSSLDLKQAALFLESLKTYLQKRGVDITFHPKEEGSFEAHFKGLQTAKVVDQHALLMDVMKQMALEYGLSCLFSEKKLCKQFSWTLLTASRKNLLETKQDPWVFLLFISTLIRSFLEHEELFLSAFCARKINSTSQESLEAKILKLIVSPPPVEKTKHAFESFVSLPLLKSGSLFVYHEGEILASFEQSACHLAPGITALQAVLADRLMLMLSRIQFEDLQGDENKQKVIFSLLKEELIEKATLGKAQAYPFSTWMEKKTTRSLEGVLDEKEIEKRHDDWIREYSEQKEEEIESALSFFQEEILLKHEDTSLFHEAKTLQEQLLQKIVQIQEMGWEAKANIFSELVEPLLKRFQESMAQIMKRKG